MDIYQFMAEIEKIWRDIKKLDEKAPLDCSAVIAIERHCFEELANICYHYKLYEEKPK